MPRTKTSKGIILATKAYKESDRIIIIYSRDFGKNTLIVKGARKPKSKKGRNIEVFNEIAYTTARYHDIEILTDVVITDTHLTIRSSLTRATVAYFIVEVIGKITQYDEKNEHLYDHLVYYLNLVGEGENLKSIRLKFIYETLVILGFWPKSKKMENHDAILQDILERKITTIGIGKKILA